MIYDVILHYIMSYLFKDYAKSAIGLVVLHLTKINEEASNVDPGMYSHTVSNSWYHTYM